MDFNYTVKDLLNTPCLKHNSKVVGGSKGLSKTVSWVHILEIRNIVKECVNGNEMVLTTGIGFITKEIAVNFMMELIDQGVSALCIETALYYHEIDKELIDIANKYDFPLIEITEVSRFVDITKELNTLLINKDSDFYQNADLYENQLSSIKSKGSIVDGLRYTAEYLGIEVAYLPAKGKHYGTTPELRNFIESKISALEKALIKDEIFYNGNIAIKQLKIYEQNWGYLVFKSKHRSISQFELLILNRLSHKICSDTLTELLKREEDVYKNNQWIKKWLNGELKEKEIKENLIECGFNRNYKKFAVCCITLSGPNFVINKKMTKQNINADQNDLFYEFLIHTNIAVKKIFNDKGISILDLKENDILYYIFLFPDETEKDIFNTISGITEQLRIYINKFIDCDNSAFIVGKLVDKHENLYKSFKTALETSGCFGNKGEKIIFYDKLYIDRLFCRLQNDPVLEEFIVDHLGILLQIENLELLHTLKVYFACNLSKQETSERLFIARQTLYFRLNKIIDILGEDFDAGNRRFALEFAIYAYDYLKSNQKSDSAI